MLRRLALVFLVSACQQPEATRKEAPTIPPAAQPSPGPVGSRFDSPQAVYKRYADTLSAAQWGEAIALFTPAGKVELVSMNFKGLAMLPGSPHPKKAEFKAVMQEFCKAHALRCANDKWIEEFALTFLAGGSVTAMMSDVTTLAAAKPDATYMEIMKLVHGVDASMIVPLDPTLTDVKVAENKATGTARRADGKTTTMSFENSPERGWMIVE